MDPSEVGALPDDEQLVFIAGHRPYRLTKLQYDKVEWMAERAAIRPHDQAKNLQTPERPPHPWMEIKPAGFGDPQLAMTFEERAEAQRLAAQAEQEATFKRAKPRKPKSAQPELDLQATGPDVVLAMPTPPATPANLTPETAEEAAANTNARNILKLLHEGDF
jgi:type IV secretion system protein VirD4